MISFMLFAGEQHLCHPDSPVMKREEIQVCFCTCDHVLVVAFAIILFDLQCNSEGIEIAVRWTGQRRVSDVCWS